MFKSILEESSTGTLQIQSVLICWTVAVVLGLIIAYVHKKTTKHTTNFLLSLTVLPLLVQIVIMMVNGNLGTSVAVLGAFSLIRFRSLPGNSKEIVSIFWAMAIGLAIGMGQVLFAVVVTIFVAIIILIMNKINFGEKTQGERKLKVVIPESLDYTNIFDDIFDKYLEKSELEKVKTTNMGSMFEIAYLIEMKKNANEKEFMDDIRTRNGNLTVMISRVQEEAEL